MLPLGPSTTATPWSPWEARAEWHDAALFLALVVAPEALQAVRHELAAGRAVVPARDAPRPVSRRVGRRPGVRPPRSC